ncbi:eukaryotic translation initiation factor 4 gamma 1 [Plakobranchus ocellatus]|uniref:Eukaryotic translation initiation factor 4 gamma 1 n=1 Tax=Plakobranchus ocellatus TaxID=259542 RepID=A0AAV4D946_9GAST|nr:eukaryotic translation initiation factor 4 gamma 1 [Plakobranchus ocellatus]
MGRKQSLSEPVRRKKLKKQRMDEHFAQMVKIAEERKSRIKFTLKDAIDLRQNNWVPRKEQTGPKKIDEVRQDFHQGATDKTVFAKSASTSKK